MGRGQAQQADFEDHDSIEPVEIVYFILFHHGEQTPLVPLPTLFGSIASDGWMTDGRPRG